MKKILALVLALMLVLSCSAMAELTFTTGGTSGTYYAFGTVLAQYITNNTDVAVTAVAGNGSAANIDLLDLGDAELGLVQNDVAYYAYNGVVFDTYMGMPVDSFTVLAALYDETVQVVTCNPEIRTIEDLRGRTVSIGSEGSGVYFNALDFLAAYGMTLDDIEPKYESFGTSADSLKDGKIDAAFIVSGAPTPAVTELCTTTGAYVISLDDEAIARMQEVSSFYTKCVIPAGTYAGIDEDIVTVAVKAIIIANGEVTDDEAYTIVSTIFENADAITAAHAKGAELDLAYATECGLANYHPGAARYFAEKGIEVPVAE